MGSVSRDPKGQGTVATPKPSVKSRSSKRKTASSKSSSGTVLPTASSSAQHATTAPTPSCASAPLQADNSALNVSASARGSDSRGHHLNKNTTTGPSSSSLGSSRSPSTVGGDSSQLPQNRARRSAPQPTVVGVPSSARGVNGRTQRRQVNPPSTQKVTVSSLPTRKASSRPALLSSEAPCATRDTADSRTMQPPAQASAKLTKAPAATMRTGSSSRPHYLIPTMSHTMYALSLRGDAEPSTADCASSLSPTTSRPASDAMVVARRKAPSGAERPGVRATTSTLSTSPVPETTTIVPPSSMQQGGAAADMSATVSPPTSAASHSMSTSATTDGAPVFCRGVVGPSTGPRRNSVLSDASSTDSQRASVVSVPSPPPPHRADTPLDSAITTTPLADDTGSTITATVTVTTSTDSGFTSDSSPPLQEWRRTPPKGILKTGEEPLRAQLAARTPDYSVAPQAASSSCAVDARGTTSTAGDSVRGLSTVDSTSRCSAPDQTRRCVRFDEENLRVTGTADTRAFVDDTSGQLRGGGGFIDPNDLNKTRHLRSPQSRGMRARLGQLGARGWGRDSAWFDNEFGLNPQVRHSPPLSIPLLSDTESFSQSLNLASPPAASHSPGCGAGGAAPTRTTFKANPFTTAAKLQRVAETAPKESGGTEHRSETPAPQTGTPDSAEVTVSRESLLVATSEPFNLQPRKPLLSTYRTTHHHARSSADDTADTDDGDCDPHMTESTSTLETPVSPTERKLLDALAKSALSSHARCEVYIASDDASRSALESSSTLQLTAVQTGSRRNSPTARNRGKRSAPSSESRGLQRFLLEAPNSEDTDRSFQHVQSPNGSTCTGVLHPDEDGSLISASRMGSIKTDEGERGTSVGSDSQVGPSEHISRSHYVLPTTMSATPVSPPTTSTPHPLTLKVNSCPSSLGSSLPTSGRSGIVRARPPRPSASSSTSPDY